MIPSRIDAIGLVAVVVVLAAAYFGVFRSGLAEQETLAGQADALEGLDEELRGLKQDYQQAQERLAPLRDSARTASQVLATPGNVDAFLAELTAIAGKAAIEIRLLQPAAPMHTGAEHYLPIHIDAVAPFPGIHQFLSRLERVDQIATVERLSISSQAGERHCDADILLHLHLPAGGKP